MNRAQRRAHASQERKADAHQQRRAQAWVNHATKTTTVQGVGSDEWLDRLHIIERNVTTIGEALAGWRATGKSLSDGVAIIVDVDDPIGEQIAKAHHPNIEPEADAMREAGLMPTLTLVIPRQAAIAGFAGTHPNVARMLREAPPAGSAYLVCVASGGATLLQQALEAS